MLNKKVIYCFITILLFITVCFLWNEVNTLDFTKRINHEKFNSYFTCIGALVTAFSLILIYLQLYESKKQNDFSIQPHLFIENRTYKILNYGGSTLVKSFINIEVPEGVSKDEWGIKLVNVGNGTALKIEADWIFDMDEVKRLSERYYDSRVEKISKYKFFKDYMRTNEVLHIGLPYVYLNLFGSKLYPERKANENIELNNKPILRVKVKYSDIQNIPYESCFKVNTKSDTTYLTLNFNLEKCFLEK